MRKNIMKNQLLAVVLAITMVLTIMPALSFADDTEKNGAGANANEVEIKSPEDEKAERTKNKNDEFSSSELRACAVTDSPGTYEIAEITFSHGSNGVPGLEEDASAYDALLDGDTLTVRYKNGTFKTYIYSKEDDDFISEDYHILNYNNWIMEWTDDDKIIIYYEKESLYANVPFTISNSIKSIVFTPVKTSYSEAELIFVREYDWEEDIFYYWLPLNLGDRVTVKWSDTQKSDTVYTYREQTYTEDGETYTCFDFVSASGDIIGVSEPFYESAKEIAVPEGVASKNYVFTVSYRYVTTTASINVKKSSDEELELAEWKTEAFDEICEFYGDIDWDLYRATQEKEIDNAFNKTWDSIMTASSINAVDSLVNSFKSFVAGVKTNAQLTAEENAAAQAAAAAAADALEWNGTPGAIPAAKSIKAKAGKGKVTVSWKKASKKNLKKFDKVEIQICTDTGFARANTKKIEVKKSAKSKKISGLAKKTAYYVRVRDVKGSGTTKIVSTWSKLKRIKTK